MRIIPILNLNRNASSREADISHKNESCGIAGITKRQKDLHQAGALMEALAETRAAELRLVWEEAHQRGPKWRQLLLSGLSQLNARPRDITLKVLKRPRDALPDIDLTFNNSLARYDSGHDVVSFTGEALGETVKCAVSREALEDHFGAHNLD